MAQSQTGTGQQEETPAWFDPSKVYVSPVTAEEAAAAQREDGKPRWPAVVGGVSLTLGVLGAPFQAALLALPAVLRTLRGLMEQAPGEVLASLPPLEITTAQKAHAAAAALSLLLLAAAGVATLLRKRAGAWMHLAYAATAGPLAVWGAVLSYQKGRELAHWAAAHADSPAARFISEPTLMGTTLQLALTLAWPVFVGVWFASRRRRQALDG
ncbi:MAG: hypothetical protein D6824_00125 [Planctomycetota bacterium]|nr:MAG: hypothetical protein D6824_00125 [Planctomycetota bacterium]